MIMDWLWQGRGLFIPTDEMFTETDGLSVDIATVLKDVWQSRPEGPNTELYPALKHLFITVSLSAYKPHWNSRPQHISYEP